MGLKSVVAASLERAAPRLWLEINIARRNRHYEPEFWLLPALCDPTQGAVDVGGNEGVFAYYLSRLSRSVDVFEPNPICLAQIARIHRGNMVVHPVALSDTAGQATLRFDPRNTGIGTIESANRLSDNPGIGAVIERDVPVCRLDDFGLTDVAFIKIDVEGHEPSVLGGAQRLLDASRPTLLVEIEKRHNALAFEQVDGLLRPFDYSAWFLQEAVLRRFSPDDVDRLQVRATNGDGRYVNNFIFIPERRAGVLERLARDVRVER